MKLTVAALVVLAMCGPGCSEEGMFESVRFRQLQLGGVTIEVEIAADEATRASGYMFREDISDSEGILFVHTSAERLGFWMKNCVVPIDIAYIDSEFRVSDIYTMAPEPTNKARSTYRTYKASTEVLYALEVQGGWFASHQVHVGDTIDLKEVLRGVQPR